MFMDISSEMIHALLPVYLVTVMGASTLSVGVIEGLAEATAAITKVFSGSLSDRLGRRKLLAAIGYGLAAFTKPVFPLASSLGWVVAARFVDRVGKGIRGAPRDALVADLAPPGRRGASFGLRQSLDTVGAFVGPGLAIVLMWLTHDHFRVVFWAAVIPAFFSFILIVFAVRDTTGLSNPKGQAQTRERPRGLPWVLPVRRLGGAYWWIVAFAAVFTMARFSEAFLILKARPEGAPIVWTPLVLVVMNIAYAGCAFPVGVLSDRLGKPYLLAIGLLLLIGADLLLALKPGWFVFWIGVVLWGLHMAFTQGVMAALVARVAPPDLRGTAFGVFNLVSGLAMLAASVLAGGLWDRFGPTGTFLAGALFAATALVGLLTAGQRMLGGPDDPEV